MVNLLFWRKQVILFVSILFFSICFCDGDLILQKTCWWLSTIVRCHKNRDVRSLGWIMVSSMLVDLTWRLCLRLGRHPGLDGNVCCPMCQTAFDAEDKAEEGLVSLFL